MTNMFYIGMYLQVTKPLCLQLFGQGIYLHGAEWQMANISKKPFDETLIKATDRIWIQNSSTS